MKATHDAIRILGQFSLPPSWTGATGAAYGVRLPAQARVVATGPRLAPRLASLPHSPSPSAYRPLLSDCVCTALRILLVGQDKLRSLRRD